jgi:Spy/CpxP family protein refolding chaperone
MKARHMIAGIACIALLVAAGSLIAGEQGPGGFFGHGQKMRGHFKGGPGGGFGGPGGFDITRMLDRIGEEIGLTEEQRTEIEAIVAEEQPGIEALREQMAELREQHRESMTPGEFDETAIRAFAQAQGNLATELMVSGARLKYRVYSVLTTEQQELLAQIREDRQSSRGGQRGFGSQSE